MVVCVSASFFRQTCFSLARYSSHAGYETAELKKKLTASNVRPCLEILLPLDELRDAKVAHRAGAVAEKREQHLWRRRDRRRGRGRGGDRE